MISKLLAFLKTRKALKELKESPIYSATLSYLQKELNDKSKGIGKYWDEEGKGRIIQNILSDIEETLAQENPTQAVRMRIINLIAETAKFQVLIIPPAPEIDQAGLRDYEGITGELKENIPRLAKTNKDLEEFFYSLEETPTSPGDMYDFILMRYWYLHLSLHAYNQVRITLGDYHKDHHKDWFRPCYISMCIWQESLYRQELGMPYAIRGTNPDWQALMHSTWINRIEEGHKEPLLEWERSWIDVFNKPSPYAQISSNQPK